MKMIDLINENHTLLLFLQHYNIDFSVNNFTVAQLCKKHDIGIKSFLAIINLYNGFFPETNEVENIKDVKSILLFLKNSHGFYKDDKYQELKFYLNKLKETGQPKDIQLIDQFLEGYFEEVLEHLNYEDEVAFPYFYDVIEKSYQGNNPSNFSVKEYLEHHTDIETKLSDLKNLLLKHLHFNNYLSIRRKFLNSLFELEYDLKIHSVVEEKILIPVIGKMEV